MRNECRMLQFANEWQMAPQADECGCARHAHAVIRASGRIPGAEGGRRSRPIESKGVNPRFEEEAARAEPCGQDR